MKTLILLIPPWIPCRVYLPTKDLIQQDVFPNTLHVVVRVVQPYRFVDAGSEQHGHVGEHAHQGEGHQRHVLGVQGVGVVPAHRVTEDMARLRAVMPGGRWQKPQTKPFNRIL